MVGFSLVRFFVVWIVKLCYGSSLPKELSSLNTLAYLAIENLKWDFGYKMAKSIKVEENKPALKFNFT